MATTKSTNLGHRTDVTLKGTTTTIETDVVVSDTTTINNSGDDVGLKINSTSSGHIMQLQDNGTDVMVVEDGGNIGVGTNDSGNSFSLGTGQILHQKKDDHVYHVMESSHGSTAKEVAIIQQNNSTGSNSWWSGLNESDVYAVAYGTAFTGANTKMVINTTGNLGINTTSPNAPIDIEASHGYNTDASNHADGLRLTNASNGNMSIEWWHSTGGTEFASIVGQTDDAGTGSYDDGNIVFRVKYNGSMIDRMLIESTGMVSTNGSMVVGYFGNSGDIDKANQVSIYDYIDASTSQRTAIHRSMQNVSGAGTGGCYWDIKSSQSTYNASMHFWFYRQWSTEEEMRFSWNGATSEHGWATANLDFAELFEWADGNPDNEDRVGLSVVNVEGKIKVATNEDQPSDIIGCISGVAGFIGNSATLHWKDKFLTDDYGRVVEEDAHAFIWTDDEGKEHQYAYDEIPEGITVPEDAERVEGKRKKVNPDFDPSIKYIPREERKEWGTVGLMGQVPVKKGSPINPNWIKLKECSSKSDWYLIK